MIVDKNLIQSSQKIVLNSRMMGLVHITLSKDRTSRLTMLLFVATAGQKIDNYSMYNVYKRLMRIIHNMTGHMLRKGPE